ncbi:transcription factor AP2-EREBP [Tripterygium wilfordii]|uniref:Transcription factor AP2-EREBP n=1 Tax=Tripterygium wilfordii TaxID=458696 RepID=A0A7J7CYU6_TRIWF|nr:transcription factor AP2-EREBP [Tripterygium wilfordii]
MTLKQADQIQTQIDLQNHQTCYNNITFLHPKPIPTKPGGTPPKPAKLYPITEHISGLARTSQLLNQKSNENDGDLKATEQYMWVERFRSIDPSNQSLLG